LYLRSKGETEDRLSKLGYETIICRVSLRISVFRRSKRAHPWTQPAYLTEVDRAKKPYEFIAPVLMAVLKLFGVSSTITVAQVGRAMALAGVLGVEKLESQGLGERRGDAWYLYNEQLLRLANSEL
jgi:hypothetical protein